MDGVGFQPKKRDSTESSNAQSSSPGSDDHCGDHGGIPGYMSGSNIMGAGGQWDLQSVRSMGVESIAGQASRAQQMVARIGQGDDDAFELDWNKKTIARWGLDAKTTFPKIIQGKLLEAYKTKGGAKAIWGEVDKLKNEAMCILYANPEVKAGFDEIESFSHVDAIVDRLEKLAQQTTGRVGWVGIEYIFSLLRVTDIGSLIEVSIHQRTVAYIMIIGRHHDHTV